MTRSFALPASITVAPSEQYNRSNEAEFRAEVSRVLATLAASAEERYVKASADYIEVPDGVTAPGAGTGKARIYVDTADGDLKVVFANGFVRTIAVDS